MAKNRGNLVGGWAFLIGVVLALVLGVMGNITGNVATILVVIGLIVGLLNIADEEASPFLLSGLVLVIISGIGGSTLSAVPYLNLDSVLSALLLIFVPATVIVAIKNVFGLAKR